MKAIFCYFLSCSYSSQTGPPTATTTTRGYTASVRPAASSHTGDVRAAGAAAAAPGGGVLVAAGAPGVGHLPRRQRPVHVHRRSGQPERPERAAQPHALARCAPWRLYTLSLACLLLCGFIGCSTAKGLLLERPHQCFIAWRRCFKAQGVNMPALTLGSLSSYEMLESKRRLGLSWG